MLYKTINFQSHSSNEGCLIALESFKNIPFDIKRVYYIYNTPYNAIRGRHAHKQLEQVIFCISGSCDFILDNGLERESVHLDNPCQGIYIKNYVWREFTNFSKNCIVVVLASRLYDESDYIRNYDCFLKFVKSN